MYILTYHWSCKCCNDEKDCFKLFDELIQLKRFAKVESLRCKALSTTFEITGVYDCTAEMDEDEFNAFKKQYLIL